MSESTLLRPGLDLASPLRSAFTVRALIVGLLAIPLNCYWVVQMELFRYSAHPTTVSLFFNVVFTLLLLQGLTMLARRYAPRLALTQAELLLIYSMVAVGTAMSSHDFLQVLYPVFNWSFYNAKPENKWETLINDKLPTWMTVQDPQVYLPFYRGGTSFYRAEYILGWLPACAMWTGFIMALVLVMLCLAVLVRKRWLEHEHLACPLVRLPVEISQPQPTLFVSNLFWVGFAIAAGMDTWNSIAFHHPMMPKIGIEHFDMGQFLRGRPWNAVGWFPRSFYPFMIGLGYLMPTDFLFSCWFFYLFWKAELIASAAFGLNQIPNFPYANFQSFGAYLLFGVSTIWIGRGYLRQVWEVIRGAPSKLTDAGEPLRYRAAALGIAVGLVALVWFGLAMGMRLWVSIAYFAIYYLLSLAISRMRAQFGAPVHDLHHTGPDQILMAAVGSENFSKRELVTFGVYFWFNRAYRGHAMPHQVEGMKMQEQVGAGNRGLAAALMLAAFVGVVAGLWTMLHLNYDLGAAMKGKVGIADGFPRAEQWLSNPTGAQPGSLIAIAVGLAFALFLETMRFRFMAWPFHPLGFAISGNWEMNLVWMPLLIAWVFKTTAIRMGGHPAYQRLVPLFLGLIVGQFVVGSIVNIISIALHVPSYMFWQ